MSNGAACFGGETHGWCFCENCLFSAQVGFQADCAGGAKKMLDYRRQQHLGDHTLGILASKWGERGSSSHSCLDSYCDVERLSERKPGWSTASSITDAQLRHKDTEPYRNQTCVIYRSERLVAFLAPSRRNLLRSGQWKGVVLERRLLF